MGKWIIKYDPNIVEGPWAMNRLQGWVFGEMSKANDDRKQRWMWQSQTVIDESNDIEDLIAFADKDYNIDLRSL